MYKIFYGDGSTHQPQDGNRPPGRDVQVILQEDGDGPYFQSGSDFYVWVDDHWLGVDHFGLYDYLLDTGLVLFGRTITNEEYQEIYQRAKVEKQTWRPKERRP